MRHFLLRLAALVSKMPSDATVVAFELVLTGIGVAAVLLVAMAAATAIAAVTILLCAAA